MIELSGVEFARAFHRELVGPLVAQHFPGLRTAAGRFGSGSDVLGLDDATSRDHDWGCRLTLLVDAVDSAAAGPLTQLLDRELPAHFRGRPVRFATSWSAEPQLQIDVATVPDFAQQWLGMRPAEDLTALEWLSLTGHSVLEAAGGPVFTDDTVELSRLRQRLSWYPESIEGYVLSCAWQRLSQTMPFVGRTADTGQELQSRLLTANLATDLIRLAFLLEQRWAPYRKWLEAVFHTLPIAESMHRHLVHAVTADTWRERENGLVAAIEVLAAKQRRRGLPTPDAAVTAFHDRPYRIVSDELAQRLWSEKDGLPFGIGSIEQWVDSSDVLANAQRRVGVIAAYQAWMTYSGAR